jgi:hypothetical protein
MVEDLLFAHTDLLSSPIVMSIKFAMKESTRTIGIAFADASARKLGVSEFVDDEMFSNTEVNREFRPPLTVRAFSSSLASKSVWCRRMRREPISSSAS